jgi:hypothetical protein
MVLVDLAWRLIGVPQPSRARDAGTLAAAVRRSARALGGPDLLRTRWLVQVVVAFGRPELRDEWIKHGGIRRRVQPATSERSSTSWLERAPVSLPRFQEASVPGRSPPCSPGLSQPPNGPPPTSDRHASHQRSATANPVDPLIHLFGILQCVFTIAKPFA